MNKRVVLALFVVGAIAVGLLVMLFVGMDRVDEDGRPNGAPAVGPRRA